VAGSCKYVQSANRRAITTSDTGDEWYRRHSSKYTSTSTEILCASGLPSAGLAGVCMVVWRCRLNHFRIEIKSKNDYSWARFQDVIARWPNALAERLRGQDGEP
jgi:hypothetical protein